MKALLTTAFLLILSCNNLCSQSSWQWQNPDPTLSDLHSVYFIDQNTGWIVGKSGTIIKTTNGCAYWTVQSIADGYPLYSVCFVNQMTGWVGGAETFIKTTNGGSTWNSAGIAGDNTSTAVFADIYFASPVSGWLVRNVYHMFGEISSIRRTTNGGLNWAEVYTSADTLINSLFFVSESTGWLTGQYGLIMKSVDGGGSWTRQASSTTGNVRSVRFYDSQTGWAITDSSAILKTTNGGMNWQRFATGNTRELRSLSIQSRDTVWAVGDDGWGVKTYNCGVTWITFSTGTGETLLSSCNRRVPWIAAGYEGMVTESNNGGVDWLSGREGLTSYLQDISFSSPDTGWAVSRTGNIFHTVNGGYDWISSNSGSTGDLLTSVHFSSVRNGWIVGFNGSNNVVLKTSNAGLNWVPQSTPETIFPQSVYFINEQTGWICGGTLSSVGAILRTVNGGANWTQTNIPDATILTDIQFENASTGWSAGHQMFSGIIVRTTDGGYNWSSTVTERNLYSLHFISSSSGWAAGGDRVLRTTDGGSIWTEVLSGAADLLSVRFTSALSGWCSGANGELLRSTNGGVSWTVVPKFTNKNLHSIFFTSAATGWIAGESGTILKTTNSGIEPVRLNLTMLIEGFYDTVTAAMIPDTVVVHLRSSSPPYHSIDSCRRRLDQYGQCELEFFNASPSSSYYLAIRHRNAIETWSAIPVYFQGYSASYDFTVNASGAYGSNQILKGSKYCFFSGDVNGDGTVDLADLAIIDNDVFAVRTGYVRTDLNGDMITDISDLLYADNNSCRYVTLMRP